MALKSNNSPAAGRFLLGCFSLSSLSVSSLFFGLAFFGVSFGAFSDFSDFSFFSFFGLVSSFCLFVCFSFGSSTSVRFFDSSEEEAEKRGGNPAKRSRDMNLSKARYESIFVGHGEKMSNNQSQVSMRCTVLRRYGGWCCCNWCSGRSMALA